jgi:hypothetical protein
MRLARLVFILKDPYCQQHPSQCRIPSIRTQLRTFTHLTHRADYCNQSVKGWNALAVEMHTALWNLLIYGLCNHRNVYKG